MKDEKYAIAGLWLLIVAFVAAAIAYAIHSLGPEMVKLATAIISAAAILLGAILTHALTIIREQQQELRKQKQTNYESLLTKLTPYVRDVESNGDDFVGAHLFSWVVGSEEVVESTGEFIKNRTRDNLARLLAAMRQDLGLAPVEVEMVSLIEAKTVVRPGLS